MSHILFILTSHDRMLNDDPTGLWLEEFAVPYVELTRAGHRVKIASVKGGSVPVDPNSEATAEQAQDWAEAIQQLQATTPLESVDADDFDAVYLPGGHGTMFDMPDNRRLHELLTRIHEAGKPIASVCHAPAVFTGMQRSDGQPFIAGRTVAAFTDSEERSVDGVSRVPFLLETRLRELGAEFQGSDDWQSNVVEDGRLITGQNPQSSAAVAAKLNETLG